MSRLGMTKNVGCCPCWCRTPIQLRVNLSSSHLLSWVWFVTIPTGPNALSGSFSPFQDLLKGYATGYYPFIHWPSLLNSVMVLGLLPCYKVMPRAHHKRSWSATRQTRVHCGPWWGNLCCQSIHIRQLNWYISLSDCQISVQSRLWLQPQSICPSKAHVKLRRMCSFIPNIYKRFSLGTKTCWDGKAWPQMVGELQWPIARQRHIEMIKGWMMAFHWCSPWQI